MNRSKIYICSPCGKSEDERKSRISVLSERLLQKGLVPVWSETGRDIGKRISCVLRCDGILLDIGWKLDQDCKDEYSIALNHRRSIFHTEEEFEHVRENFVL